MDAFSLHTILQQVFDSDNVAIRIIAESNGGSGAKSSHSIVRAVYDPDTDSIRVTQVGDTETPRFGGYLNSNQATGQAWTPIPWHSETKEDLTHSNGSPEVTVGTAGDYMIMVNLTSDFNADNEIQYLKLQKAS